MNWYIDVLKNYATFDGRAGREEYWNFTLLNVVVGIALYVANQGMLGVYLLAVLIPSIAVSVRRLHDVNRSGWWLLLAAVPVLGIAFLYFMLQDGMPGANRYGFNPKDVIA